MDGRDLPGHIPHLSPGMSQVIEAGEKYTIKDDKGGEIELDVRDRPWTVDFLTAFDNFMEASAKLGSDNVHTERFASEMRTKWLTMPDDLKKLLPSGRERGVRL